MKTRGIEGGEEEAIIDSLPVDIDGIVDNGISGRNGRTFLSSSSSSSSSPSSFGFKTDFEEEKRALMLETTRDELAPAVAPAAAVEESGVGD